MRIKSGLDGVSPDPGWGGTRRVLAARAPLPQGDASRWEESGCVNAKDLKPRKMRNTRKKPPASAPAFPSFAWFAVEQENSFSAFCAAPLQSLLGNRIPRRNHTPQIPPTTPRSLTAVGRDSRTPDMPPNEDGRCFRFFFKLKGRQQGASAVA